MAASNSDPRMSDTDRTVDQPLTRYDALLLVIPAAFVLALVAAQVSPLRLSTLMAAASLVGAVAVADGLFVNPPLR
jgi:hypothetical protein